MVLHQHRGDGIDCGNLRLPVALANSAALGADSWARVCACESCHAFFASLWQLKHFAPPTYSCAAADRPAVKDRITKHAVRQERGGMRGSVS